MYNDPYQKSILGVNINLASLNTGGLMGHINKVLLCIAKLVIPSSYVWI